MPASLEESLRAALISANDGFDAADADLHREVAAAAQALAAVTQGKAKLTLGKMVESESYVRYGLSISGGGDSKELSRINVSAKGYPINITDSAGNSIKYCTEKEALTSYFSNLATNPDSPLVTFAAYILRKK